MPEALQSSHGPLVDPPAPALPATRRARVHVLRRGMPEVPARPRWQDHLHDLLEPLLFAATLLLAVLLLGLWAGAPARARQATAPQAQTLPAPAPAPSATPVQAG